MTTLRVLLVDDEPEFLEPTAARLERRGMVCARALSGEQALETLAVQEFDCAIIDVKMRGMDGLELLRRVRRERPDMAAILLTGHASVELGLEGMELGAFEYLLKPIEIDELVDTIRRAAHA